jgi:hypothetical protein
MITVVGSRSQPTQGPRSSEIDAALKTLAAANLNPQHLAELAQIREASIQGKISRGIGVRSGPSGFEVNLEHGSLKVATPGAFGTHALTLTLRGVVAGSTQATVEALCQEINKVAAKLLHYPKDWKVELSNNGDLPSGVGDMTVLITPLVLDSISRQREQTEVVNGSERCSQMELLRSYGLQEVENDFLRVAVGLFQVGVGFSPEKYEIGRGSTSESV